MDVPWDVIEEIAKQMQATAEDPKKAISWEEIGVARGIGKAFGNGT